MNPCRTLVLGVLGLVLHACGGTAEGTPCGTSTCEPDETCSLDTCVEIVGSATVSGWSEGLGAKAHTSELPVSGDVTYEVIVSEHAACFALGDPSDGTLSIMFPGEPPLNTELTSDDGVSTYLRLPNAASSEAAETITITVTALDATTIAGTFSASFPTAGSRSGTFSAEVCSTGGG